MAPWHLSGGHLFVYHKRMSKGIVSNKDPKLCSKCKDLKPLTSFSPRRGVSGAHSSWCKACVAQMRRDRYRRDVNANPKPRVTPSLPTKPPTMLDVAWAAGFLEGEGSFGGVRTSYSQNVSAFQVQREPLDRLQRMFGGYLHPRRRQDRKDAYYWRVNGEQARRVMVVLYPWMSPRRQEQMQVAFSLGSEFRNGRRPKLAS